MLNLVTILTKFGDHQHIQREKAISELKSLGLLNEEEKQVCFKIFSLMATSSRWEDRYGALKGA